MTDCQNHACRRPTELFLCQDCEDQLANMLDQVPWLLEELDARIQKLDRVGVGTIGRNRRPEGLSVMDFDAAEKHREVRKTLLKWVEHIATHHLGRTPPGLSTVATKHLAKWLHTNVKHVARDTKAGKLYDAVNAIVGTSQEGGELVRAINPIEKHLVGPCPTIVGRNRDGAPRQCGRTLFADTYDRTTTCPDCQQDIDVKENRVRAAEERDLHTKSSLLELLDSIDEAVTEQRLNLWIEARRLRPRGWLHDGDIREFRVNDNDQPLYSVERARKLRRRDDNLRTRRRLNAS